MDAPVRRNIVYRSIQNGPYATATEETVVGTKSRMVGLSWLDCERPTDEEAAGCTGLLGGIAAILH